MKLMAFVVFSSLLALPVALSAQGGSAEDPLLGTWRLNVAQSKYRPGPPPKSQTRTYEKYRDGIRATVRTVFANGRSTTVQTVYDYDNQEHPVTGSEEVDSILMKRVDARTHEATLTHAGRQVGTFRRVISADGKTMRVFDVRQSPAIDNEEVYEKDDQ